MIYNTVRINIKNKEDYKNIYNDNELSSELKQYILDHIKSKNTKQNIKLDITTDFKMDDKDRLNLTYMIRRAFGLDVSEIMNIAKKRRIKNLLIFLIGIFFLIAYSFIPKTIFINELILIIGWVLIWESIYNFLFKNIETKLMILRRKQIIKSKIQINKES